MTLGLHVLPVGRSLLGRAEDANRPDLRALATVLDPRSFDLTTNPHRRVADELAGLSGDGWLPLTAVLTADQRDLCQRRAEVDSCAEWSSVARAVCGSDPATAHVLIASDTNDGLRSAVLAGARFAADHGRDHLRYLHDPVRDRDRRITPGDVWIVRIPGLDFLASSIPDDAWYALGSIGHIVQTTACTTTIGTAGEPERWAVTLHLTGGYKGMLPYLLIMAEGVQTAFKAHTAPPHLRPTITALSVHEHHPDVPLPQRTPIELPVRWIRGDALAALRELATYTTADPGVPVSGKWDEWRGQWVTDGGGRLNTAGMILTRTL